MATRAQQIVGTLVEVLCEWDVEPDEADKLLEDAKGDYRNDYDRRAEDALIARDEAHMEERRYGR